MACAVPPRLPMMALLAELSALLALAMAPASPAAPAWASAAAGVTVAGSTPAAARSALMSPPPRQRTMAPDRRAQMGAMKARAEVTWAWPE